MKLTQQLQRFIITGLANTGFAYGVYAFCDLGLHMDYFWAATAAWCIGVCFSYMMFRTFVFTEGDRSWRSFKRFIPTYVFQALMVVFCAGLSFIINRIFVFK